MEDSTLLSTVIASVISAVVALAGIWGTARLAKRQQASVDSNSEYDQLQEDIKELRVEVKRLGLEARHNRRVIIHLENEVQELRQGIMSGGLTAGTLGPRPAYPPHPQDGGS